LQEHQEDDFHLPGRDLQHKVQVFLMPCHSASIDFQEKKPSHLIPCNGRRRGESGEKQLDSSIPRISLQGLSVCK
jgi:hypothetical protein